MGARDAVRGTRRMGTGCSGDEACEGVGRLEAWRGARASNCATRHGWRDEWRHEGRHEGRYEWRYEWRDKRTTKRNPVESACGAGCGEGASQDHGADGLGEADGEDVVSLLGAAQRVEEGRPCAAAP